MSPTLGSYVRNPNYLGEVLIYSAFCLLCRSLVSNHTVLWARTLPTIPLQPQGQTWMGSFTSLADLEPFADAQ